MDPLSITASVVGLLGAAGKVYTILETLSAVKDCPATIRDARAEVKHTEVALGSLQQYLQHLDLVDPQRAALIQVDELRVTLGDAMLVFSEFEGFLGLLSRMTRTRMSMAWMRHSTKMNEYRAKIQRYTSSLNLMLSIIQCKSQLEALQSQKRLQTTVENIVLENQTLKRLLMQSNDAPVDRFAFESILLQSWVYRRNERNECDVSFVSSVQTRSYTRSVYSGYSLADISILSVVAMPFTLRELANCQHYEAAARSPPEPAMEATASNPSESLTKVAANSSSEPVMEALISSKNSGVEEQHPHPSEPISCYDDRDGVFGKIGGNEKEDEEDKMNEGNKESEEDNSDEESKENTENKKNEDSEENEENEASKDDGSDRISSSPSIDGEDDIDFELCYALHSFVASVDGQATVIKGAELMLLDDSNMYWWLVRVMQDATIGYLPAEHVETPTERLARLNKHRNIDTAGYQPRDHMKPSKPSIVLRRPRKTVQFNDHPVYISTTSMGGAVYYKDGAWINGVWIDDSEHEDAASVVTVLQSPTASPVDSVANEIAAIGLADSKQDGTSQGITWLTEQSAQPLDIGQVPLIERKMQDSDKNTRTRMASLVPGLLPGGRAGTPVHWSGTDDIAPATRQKGRRASMVRRLLSRRSESGSFFEQPRRDSNQ